MIRQASLAVATLLLGACAGEAAPQPSKATSSPCVLEEFEGSQFTHCVAVPGKHTVRAVLAGPDGVPYRSLSAFAASRPSAASPVAFAMNGGMYDDDGLPIGYYVEDGRKLHELNRREGGGNFGLLPNGVFSVESDGWRVRSADTFAAEVRTRPRYATQSGPMLVIGGKLHPKIAHDGESLNIRNAVGVDRKGRAHFVISEVSVSFGRLARYMRDDLGCPDALYLDGSVSALWDPAIERVDGSVPLGPLIVVENAPKGRR